MSMGATQPKGEILQVGEGAHRSCFQGNLPGEYLAMALNIHASLGFVGWMLGVWFAPSCLILLVAGAWIVCRSSGLLVHRWYSLFISASLAYFVFSLSQSGVSLPHPALTFFSPVVFLAMLLVTLTADVVELTPMMYRRAGKLGSKLPWQRMVIWGFVLTFVIYMILIPTVGWVIELTNPPKSEVLLEEASLMEMIRIRTMEAMSALWFIALGATIGSFLNVVVYRLPRGESVMFRRSHCPKCGTNIKGRDNVPIFGWLMLSGHCRSCHASISARYPIVELTSAIIFLMLFFVELISGGINIPIREPNSYRGVVWILLYTKWDLLGLYLYHCLGLSILLTYALIDFDRQRVGLSAKVATAIMLIAPTLVWPHFHPVPVWVASSDWLPVPWLEPAMQCLVGGLMGVALGAFVKLSVGSKKPDLASPVQIYSSLAIVGVTLGWQAVVSVTLIALLMRLVVLALTHRQFTFHPFTLLVLAASVTHLISWRWSSETLSPWWPSHTTTPLGWVAVAVGLLVLATANRALGSYLGPAPATEGSDDESETPRVDTQTVA